MTAQRQRSPLVWTAGLALLMGCSNSSTGANTSSSSGSSDSDAATADVTAMDAGATADADLAGSSDAGDASDSGAEDVVCPTDAVDATSFKAGAALTSDKKKVQAKVVSAMPEPPERYNNDWVIEFMDESGQPLDDMELTKAYASMPYHGHGKPAFSMMKLSEPGQFDVGVSLFMRGYFDVQLTVSSPTAGDDMLHFKYCVR